MNQKTQLKAARQNVLYCRNRDLNLLSATAHRAKVKYYRLMVDLLRGELRILRGKSSPSGTRTIQDYERTVLKQEIDHKKQQSLKYREWLRQNGEQI